MTGLITSSEAAKLIGVSEVMIFKWRKAGHGPTVYPGHGRSKYLYDPTECVLFGRERMDPVNRIRELERRLDALEAVQEA